MWISIFEKRVNEGFDILHIAFSSALSSSYNNACIAANEVMEEHPGARIVVVDSLAASMGEGLIVYKAVEMKKSGKSMDEIIDFVNNHKLNVVHNFTVDDLNHLYRGGRVSKTTAIIGTLANIKPILHVDDEGRLINIGKVRGRKKSLIALVDRMEEHIGSYRDKNDVVFISHGDCLQDAQFVAGLVKERFGIETTKIIRTKNGKCMEVPIIAMTADGFETDIGMLQKAGMSGLISKPVDVNTLVEHITKLAGW